MWRQEPPETPPLIVLALDTPIIGVRDHICCIMKIVAYEDSHVFMTKLKRTDISDRNSCPILSLYYIVGTIES